jgi:hypothetical protein
VIAMDSTDQGRVKTCGGAVMIWLTPKVVVRSRRHFDHTPQAIQPGRCARWNNLPWSGGGLSSSAEACGVVATPYGRHRPIIEVPADQLGRLTALDRQCGHGPIPLPSSRLLSCSDPRISIRGAAQRHRQTLFQADISFLDFQVGIDHHFDQLRKVNTRTPAEFRAGLASIADQGRDIGRPEETCFLGDVRVPILYFHMIKSDLKKIADGMSLAGRYDIIVRFLLLEHKPHRLNVVTSETPVTGHVHVANGKDLLASQRDPSDSPSHLSRNELKPTTR